MNELQQFIRRDFGKPELILLKDKDKHLVCSIDLRKVDPTEIIIADNSRVESLPEMHIFYYKGIAIPYTYWMKQEQ